MGERRYSLNAEESYYTTGGRHGRIAGPGRTLIISMFFGRLVEDGSGIDVHEVSVSIREGSASNMYDTGFRCARTDFELNL